MALMAVVAVVVGPLGGDLAVGSQPGLGPVLDEAGVGLAVRADDAGAAVALFLPASRPVWCEAAARSWAKSRRSYSIWPKARSSGRSTRRSAIWRRMWSALGRRRCRRAWMRVSRSSAVG